ncbi:MAG: hypothetical protein JXB07_15265 [Anaerolineae bacterium]|nr:hypothetical protein [Anaerolineae bacterium]
MLITAKSFVKRNIYRLGKFYQISPKNLLEGIDICRALHERGISSTLGKFSEDGDDPEQLAQECQMASDALKAAFAGERFCLSLKPPAFHFDLETIMPIVATALANGHSINFDAHEHTLANPTIHLLEQVMSRSILPNRPAEGWIFSLVLPTRWKRSLVDAKWAIQNGVRVRLVKGEFKGLGSSEEMDPTAGFLSLIDRLAGNVPEIAVATHDNALAREAINRCKNGGCKVRLELLFGMPIGNMMVLSREMNVPVRIYVPYGENLLIYGMRHFLTHPYKLFRPGLLEAFSSRQSKLARIAGL